IPVVTSINPSNIATGTFLLTVNGNNFVPGAIVTLNGQSLTTLFVSSTELDAIGTVTTAGNLPVAVIGPNPGSTNSAQIVAHFVSGSAATTQAAAVRFLEQASFGPTPESINQVSQLGFDNYLASQFAAPSSIYPNPSSGDSISNVQNQFFFNA